MHSLSVPEIRANARNTRKNGWILQSRLSNVEPEVHDVAVAHGVFLALDD